MNDRLTHIDHDRSRRALRSGYDRFTRVMRWLLLTGAGATIITVFVLAVMNEDPDRPRDPLISTGTNDTTRLGLENARYSAKDSTEQQFYVTAKSALHHPDRESEVELDTLQADMALSGDMWVSVSSPSGIYQQNDQMLMLDGGVNVFSDRGYEFHTEVGLLDLVNGRATFALPVKGQGPFGYVEADSAVIEDHGQRILLEGQVKLTILGAVLGEQE